MVAPPGDDLQYKICVTDANETFMQCSKPIDMTPCEEESEDSAECVPEQVRLFPDEPEGSCLDKFASLYDCDGTLTNSQRAVFLRRQRRRRQRVCRRRRERRAARVAARVACRRARRNGGDLSLCPGGDGDGDSVSDDTGICLDVLSVQ